MKIRSLQRFFSSPLFGIMMVLVALLIPCVLASPADRRTMGLVDRLMRANPLRQLANLIGRKLSLDLYHPPERPRVIPVMTVTQVPGQMQATHYVKIPTWHQVYYPPPPAPVAMMPVYPRHPQKYFLHGVSYPVPFIPQQQPVNQPMQVPPAPAVNVQPSASTYTPPQPVLVTESTVTSAIQFEQPQQPSMTPNNAQYHNHHLLQQQQTPAEVTQAPAFHQTEVQTQSQRQLVSEYYMPLQSQPSSQSLLSPSENVNQVESPSEPRVPPETETPSIVDSANRINEMDISTDNINPLQEQLPAPPSSENLHMDAINNANSMRIILIQPTDLERTRTQDTEASELSDFMKGYSMKFIDLDEGAQEMVVTSQRTANSKPEVVNKSCVEPLCDSFLRKLIPELLQSAGTNQKNDEPYVIIKSDGSQRHEHNQPPSTSTSTPDYSSYLQNHKIVDSFSSPEPEVSVVRAVEESELHDTLQAQSSTLKPQKVYYPRKLISSKINATYFRNLKPKQKNHVISSTTSLKAPIPSTRNEKVLKKLQRFQNYRLATSSTSPSYRRSIQLESLLSPTEDSSNVALQTLIPFPRSYQLQKGASPVYPRRTRRGKSKRVTRGGRSKNENKEPTTSTESVQVASRKSFQKSMAGVVFNDN